MPSVISSAIDKFKEKITDLFTKDSIFIPYMALASGFIKRHRVIKPEKLISTLAIASFRSKPSTLTEKVSIYKSLGSGISLRPQSLQERLNSEECVEFVKMTLQALLKTKILSDFSQSEVDLLNMFRRVLIEDSSSFELSKYLEEKFKGFGGNSSKSSLKMSSLYDLKTAKFIHLEEFSGVTSDRILGTRTIDLINEGDLLLRDLGYLKVKDLIRIKNKGAYFLSRLSGSMSIFETQTGESIPFPLLFQKHNRNGLLDMDIYLGKEKLLTRIVAYIVPEEVANKRRRNLNKNAKCKGRKTSVENAARQNFSIYITNVPKEIWPVEVVQTVYRLRWQIELIFRSWKSQLKIHIILGTNENRIRLLLYAKWLAIIICASVHEIVIWYAENVLNREASFHKTINFLLLQKRFEDLLQNPKKVLKQLLNELRDGWLKDKRRKDISTKEMVKNKMPSYV